MKIKLSEEYFYNLYKKIFNNNIMKSFGYELLLDCKKCNKLKIKNEQLIRDFIDEVLLKTKMKKWGDLVLQNLQTGPKHLIGYSAVQLIHTSSFVCHFCNESGDIYIDFFSCKKFDPEVVMNCVNKYFSPKKMRSQFIKRDTNF